MGLILGAVAYDPKVVTIWDGFKEYFLRNDLDFDYVLYSNYESQVRAHIDGHFDVAWNSPLAWVETERELAGQGLKPSAIAMRDTDRELTSLVVVRSDSPVRDLSGLRGKTVAVGAEDSPQATLIPLLHLADAGLEAWRDFRVQIHDLLRGKHGDHIGGERDAARALMSGDADAACMIDGNYLLFAQEGTLSSETTRILARTDRYDHCNFTVIGDAQRSQISRFRDLIMAMRYDDPGVRPLLDLEGLKRWKPGRTSGYGLLNRAVDLFGPTFSAREE